MDCMRKCLIIVDYQNDFVNGSLGFSEAAALAPRIAAKIRGYRESGGDIIFTLDTHGENYSDTQEGRFLPVLHCLENTPGHELADEIARLRQETDRCFYKNTFGSDALYEYLKMTPYEKIELAGLVSNICVLSNAVLAKTAQPETPIYIDAACTASSDHELQEAALDVMAALQIRIENRK